MARAEQLLAVRLHEYRDEADGAIYVAPDSDNSYYSVPTALATSLAFIHVSSAAVVEKGTTTKNRRRRSRDTVVQQFSRRQEVKKAANGTSSSSSSSRWDCLKYMTPECLSRLYNMPLANTNTTAAHPNNSFGIFQPAWQTWIPAELDAFFAEFRPELVGHRPKMLPVNGGYRQTETVDPVFNLEPHLDFEYGMALAYPQSVADIQVGSADRIGNTNVMLAALDPEYCDEHGIDETFDAVPINGTDCGTLLPPPLVISISAAWNEAGFSHAYLERQCLEFLKLALRGTSVVASTGDRGTADQLLQCRDPTTGRPDDAAAGGFFSAVFPASCPWVTAVGGTQLSSSSSSSRRKNTTTTTTTTSEAADDELTFPSETAFHLKQTLSGRNYTFTSGGGFSNVFTTPSYQQAAVHSYLAHPRHGDHLANLSSAGYFDRRGRGYPDVAAAALNYLVRSGGRRVTASGTSASAPVFAAMIARVNDARLKAGKSPVGFLNPVLYSGLASAAGALRDTRAGFNEGCGVPGVAFPASDRGWDAVTGLGSPDFGRLLGVFLGLP